MNREADWILSGLEGWGGVGTEIQSESLDGLSRYTRCGCPESLDDDGEAGGIIDKVCDHYDQSLCISALVDNKSGALKASRKPIPSLWLVNRRLYKTNSLRSRGQVAGEVPIMVVRWLVYELKIPSRVVKRIVRECREVRTDGRITIPKIFHIA